MSTLYIDRHDSVARNIYHILCRGYDLYPPYYTHKGDIIRHNKSDLIAFDKIRKTALIIEFVVSWSIGIGKQIELKRNCYCVNGNWDNKLKFPYPRGDNLVSELTSKGWKVTLLPMVIGATGEILSDLKDQIKEGVGLS